MVLDESSSLLDISEPLDAISYTIVGANPLVVGIRIDLGTEDAPIHGSGSYLAELLINGRLVIPAEPITIGAEPVKAALVSRQIYLLPGDRLVVRLTGVASDVAVYVGLTLFDFTPVLLSTLTTAVLDTIAASLADINDDVVAAISGLDITVRPAVSVLGPCKKGVTQFDLPR